MKKRLTTEEFISKARDVHGDKYDYSRMTYVNSRTKVCIVCPVHGEFLISPNNHLRGKGCARCAGNKKMSNQEIIEKALLVHGDKYDYSMAFCEENKGKMTIICPKHGIFKQSIKRHIGGQGCPICGREKMGHYHKSNVEEFSLRGKEIHGDRYDYSKVEYKNCDTKVCIICPKHGEFWQTPYAHINRKQGCPMCDSTKISERLRMKREDFELRAREVHGEKYDYSNVEYKGRDEPICIVCPTHGSFWQDAEAHMCGRGCPKCSKSLGEKKIAFILNKYGIKYEHQYRIITDLKLFGKHNCFIVDFYLPKENLIIEFNGKQHYVTVPHFHRDISDFLKQKKRDQKLREWCKDNKVRILEIKYDQIDNIEEILSNHINIDKYEKNYTQKTKNE